MEQRSEEWIAARLGKATASRVADICTKTKTGWGASRANYKAELVSERLTGVPAERYINAAMQWGTDTEPDALRAYEFMEDQTVQPVGFVPHPRIAMAGASPDGMVGNHGLVEIKCPNTSTHIETLLGRTTPSRHLLQIQFQLACTNRAYCDFVSYDPRMPPAMQLFVHRVLRDERLIVELEQTIEVFVAEVASTLAELAELYGPTAAGAAVAAEFHPPAQAPAAWPSEATA